MGTRRQPSEEFIRRLKAYSESTARPASLIRRYKESDAWLWTEVAAVVIGLMFFIPTAFALRNDLEDRQRQRVVQAWQLITQKAPGNSGKGPALEYLVSHKIPLVGINLSAESNQAPSYLVGVHISHADLSYANLNGADLTGADLRGAKLILTQLEQAVLVGANLTDADFRGANLSNAELSGADLRGAINLDKNGLYFACIDEKTQLPNGFPDDYQGCLEI